MIKRFMDWWERQPTYKAVWLIPLILILFVVAKLINLFKRSKDNGNYIQGSIDNQDR